MSNKVVSIVLLICCVSCAAFRPQKIAPPPLSRTYPPVDVAIYQRPPPPPTPTPLPIIPTPQPPNEHHAPFVSTLPAECQTTRSTQLYRVLTFWKEYYHLRDVHAPNEQVQPIYQNIRTLQECLNHAPISAPQ